ncbi:hypothetical protein RS3R6_36310 [Pseudomonas atacamensis]|jgi:hypothetical protein|uniref:Ndc10 domain-containing protein n=1 Tax=Pseudomonas atacamensis TaxID=2565368 RepID=A0ABQ5PHR6_9PSED|nr:hypothetical protein RS3R1_21350 [Pseudomonas atacamensis]GLH55449.1 hypothetical protein RS3R6_36310 [Pseudomonas atacamensis]
MQSTLKKGVDFQAPDGDGMASQERGKHFHRTKNKACMTYVMQALDIYGARSRNRTGTPLRAGDFKSVIFFF